MFYKSFLINAKCNRFPHRRVRSNRAFKIHPDKKSTACGSTAEGICVRLKQRVTRICHSVRGVNLSAKQCICKRVSVGNRAHRDFIDVYLTIPVIIIFDKGQVVVRHKVHCNIRTGSHNNPLFIHAFFYIYNTSVWVTQIMK